MMEEAIKMLYQEYLRVLEIQKFRIEDLDYTIANEHIEFLKQLDRIENSSISVFDLYRKEHIFVSSNYSKMLGYNLDLLKEQGNDFFDSRVHPEDFFNNMKMGIGLLKTTYQIPVSERKDYKLVLDYRVRNGKDDYVRIIEQQQALELDRAGNIWLALSTVDFSPDQDLSSGPRSRIYNFKNGEIKTPQAFEGKGAILSKREQEVLSLVREGFPSKQIAEKLFISIHTVNTHRQRILEKLNASNSYEAVQYASRLGLLS